MHSHRARIITRVSKNLHCVSWVCKFRMQRDAEVAGGVEPSHCCHVQQVNLMSFWSPFTLLKNYAFVYLQLWYYSRAVSKPIPEVCRQTLSQKADRSQTRSFSSCSSLRLEVSPRRILPIYWRLVNRMIITLHLLPTYSTCQLSLLAPLRDARK